MTLSKNSCFSKIHCDYCTSARYFEKTREQLFYGYGWVIDKTQNTNLVWHNGGWFGFFADMRRYLDRDMAVIFLTNTPGAMAEQTEEKVLNILLAQPIQQKTR